MAELERKIDEIPFQIELADPVELVESEEVWRETDLQKAREVALLAGARVDVAIARQKLGDRACTEEVVAYEDPNVELVTVNI